jgi:phosphopentomutase
VIGAQPQAIFLAGSHLAGHQHAASAAMEAQQHTQVIVNTASGDVSGQIGTYRSHLQLRDMFGKLETVRADITKAASAARNRRIGAPTGLPVSSFF